jgi:CHAD domain-containing protein
MKTLARIVRTELPVRAKIVAAKPFALFAALHLRKLLRKACQEDDWQRDERRKTIHRARSRIRHARYLAELFASALCPETAELAERLHVVEQNLGRAHDMDRAASFLEAETASAPRPLIRQIARRRKQSLRRAADALDQLRRKKFEKGLKRSAKKARLAGRP